MLGLIVFIVLSTHTYFVNFFCVFSILIEAILSPKSSAELPMERHCEPVVAGNLRSCLWTLVPPQGAWPCALTL